MATPDAGGPSRQPPVHIDDGSGSQSSGSQSSDSGSASHSYGLGQQPAPLCRWRTGRYHHRECSRYFDCPTHIVERALSDAEQYSEEEQEQEDAQGRPDPSTVSPLSEDGEETDGHHRTRPPLPEPPVAAGEPLVTMLEGLRLSGAVGSERDGPGESPSTPDSPVGNQPFQPHTRTEAGRPEARGSGNGDGGSGVPPPPIPPMPRDRGPIYGRQAIDVSAAGPAPATRLISRPAPTLSSPTTGPSEVMLPRWQPDSEATYCPICGTQFSFFVRKHHCRKCGRVVCHACSPHRITIPHQYIVRPPGAPRPLAQGASLSLLDSQGWYPEFGGGERVRLCNPCVPDPNIAPPHAHGGQARSPSTLNSPVQADNMQLSNRWSYYFGAGAVNDAQTRTRSATMQPGPSSSRPPLPPHRGNEGRILWGTPPAYYRSASSSQAPPHLYPGVAPRHRSMLDVGDRPGPSSAAGPSTAPRRFHPAMVAPPRPPVAEEDECPVCHRELPPRSLPNFESLREAHITSCITSHSRYGGPATATTTLPAGGDGDDPDMLPSAPPRRTGMFPYTATEKDCVDSAECSICLEEFEEGVAMARLECLCRFHRMCINAWWERHPGRCPMHQHDGFGY